MPLSLVAVDNGIAIGLAKPVILVGRHPECDIQLESKKISRRHCCIAFVDQHLAVRDLGSMNGIRINGERVLDGRLKVNDELTIGNLRYTVQFTEQEIKPPINAAVKKKSSRSNLPKPKPPSGKPPGTAPSSKIDLLAPDDATAKSASHFAGQWQMGLDPSDPMLEKRE